MLGKISKLSRSKAPKRSKIAVTDIRQKPVDFYIKTTWASTLSSCNNVQNLGSFAQVSIPVMNYNSLS